MKSGLVIYKDEQDKFRWRLTARNGNILADSGEGYDSRQALMKGVRAVTKFFSAVELKLRDETR